MRLNNKTIRNYLYYSSVLFLLSIPVFYFVMQQVLLDSVDHSLKNQLHEIRENLREIRTPEELSIWSKLDKDISLFPATSYERDRLYSIDRFSERHHEAIPFREIAGTIEVDGKMYRLVVSSSLIENDDLLASILFVQVAVLAVLIGGMLWINQRAIRRLWRPFYVALSNIQQFELNKNKDLPFLSSTTDEFNQLNGAIRNLFSRNYEIFLQQKEFTENASHEMQTPLAIFQTKLELLMQTSPLSEEQALLIHSLDTTNRRLVKLNKSLLLLTKIENNQYHQLEELDIAALCQRMIGQFRVHAESKAIRIYDNCTTPVLLYGNLPLIEILVSNLLSNAIRYNREAGEIVVTTMENRLIIENTGMAEPLHAEKIFDRFHKHAGSVASEESTGLGLAIVKNICVLYHHQIEYSFRRDRHCFEIVFAI